MRIEFAKMHGLGNDFVVMDASRKPLGLDRAQIAALADRRRGVGFDQLLVIEPSRREDADFRYRIYNADGSEAEHCGNGARCFARYVHEAGLSGRDPLVLETGNGLISVAALADGHYRVEMGVPELEPARIPFIAEARAGRYTLEVDGREVDIGAVSVGNPHAVLQVADVEAAPVATLGPAIERHPRFPNRVNVGFCRVVDRTRVDLRVWERGVGETAACGTGACAAVVSLRVLQLVGERVTVRLRGGDLLIEWPGEGRPLAMSGPTARVFDASMDL